MMMIMMNHHVILSVFWTALVGNCNNGHRACSSRYYQQIAPPHIELGSTASFVRNKRKNHPLHFEFPYRLTRLAAAANTASNIVSVQLSVEGGVKDTANNNSNPKNQPQSLLKAETTTTPGFDHAATRTAMPTKTGGGPFMDRVRQLLDFRQKHGHCLVPKRHLENPSLGNWINKQRQEFKRFQLGKKPCALTPERIHLLESIGMCWDASASNPTSTTLSSSTLNESHENDNDKQETAWQEELQDVKNYMQLRSLTSVMELPRQSFANAWIKQQREKYGKLAVVVLRGQDGKGARDDDDNDHRQQTKVQLLGDDTTMMIDATARRRIQQLFALDCDWYMSRRQAIWECRFRELKEYYERYGDCCVPISYKASPQLAHWVSNQRKLYNQSRRRQQEQYQDELQNHHHHHHQQHQHQHQAPSISSETSLNQHQHYGSTTTNRMTEERFSRLQAIGFVWNRWDYEFAKKR